MAGWALLVSTSMFMVSATLPIANAILLLFAPNLVNNVNYIAIISAVCLTIISIILLKGIKVSSYIQNIITVIEMVILFVLLAMGINKYAGNDSLSYISNIGNNNIHIFNILSPFNFTTQIFVAGSIIAIFFYWGWDVILNLSEETKNKSKTPSKSVYFAMFSLIAIFMSFTILTMMALSAADIEKYNTNILYAIAENVWGSSYAYMAAIVVLLSTLGTIETGMLQFTRTLFATSRDGMLHIRYSAIHNKWQTPWVATITIWAIAMLMILASSYMESVNKILQVSISAIGLLICFYLSMAGLACAYHYKYLFKSFSIDLNKILEVITHIIYSLLSALFLIYIAIYSFIDFDNVTRIIGLGGLLSGLIPLGYFYCKRK